ncbi:MAG TPA: GNAT family N-acetyltransferase [Povalibacter sp.]|uniref:GNAT family N-acetyltransferase n=1 Tax=Povalibacter sp. TaxID=1962978 RepID=UPI002CE7A97E|nr:GNAT family N-acetyltransferase [Povalibacter sp.]HMN45907.1 GNAT family N-acetyltransferase [Povalibacter sp.]
MPDSLVLGPAKIGDAPAIANMSRLLIEPGLPWRWTPRRVAAHMKERENLVVVARDGRSLVGFAMAQFGTDAVHLTLIGVAADRRRSGIGRQLLAWVEDSAMVAGIFRMNLEVRAGNREARSFYSRLGYKENGRVTGYYSGIEDAIRLTRDLRVTASS